MNNTWWGVTGLASANLSDSVHAEVGAGYKNRQGDSHNGADFGGTTGVLWKYKGFDYSTWGILGGVYYTPVDQLTIGLEGEWYTADTKLSRKGRTGTVAENYRDTLDVSSDNWTVDLVSVWRF